jgi:hypothetical protein
MRIYIKFLYKKSCSKNVGEVDHKCGDVSADRLRHIGRLLLHVLLPQIMTSEGDVMIRQDNDNNSLTSPRPPKFLVFIQKKTSTCIVCFTNLDLCSEMLIFESFSTTVKLEQFGTGHFCSL